MLDIEFEPGLPHLVDAVSGELAFFHPNVQRLIFLALSAGLIRGFSYACPSACNIRSVGLRDELDGDLEDDEEAKRK